LLFELGNGLETRFCGLKSPKIPRFHVQCIDVEVWNVDIPDLSNRRRLVGALHRRGKSENLILAADTFKSSVSSSSVINMTPLAERGFAAPAPRRRPQSVTLFRWRGGSTAC
jgi:hypothetical protein